MRVASLDQIENQPLSLRLTLQHDLFIRQVHYPMIVEIMENKIVGRVKRQYLKEFDETERKLISYYKKLFYQWYLVKGSPDQIQLKVKTLSLLSRLSHFCGSI